MPWKFSPNTSRSLTLSSTTSIRKTIRESSGWLCRVCAKAGYLLRTTSCGAERSPRKRPRMLQPKQFSSSTGCSTALQICLRRSYQFATAWPWRSKDKSDRLHRDRSEIFYQSHFLLQEWFRISHASQEAIEACHSFDASANFGLSGEQILTRLLIAELRFVRHQRLETRFEQFGDVNDEGGTHVVIESCVNNLERAVRLRSAGILLDGLTALRRQRCGQVARIHTKFQLRQSSQKAGFISQCRRGVMIGMAAFPVRKYHHAGPLFTDHARDFQTVFESVLNPPIRDIESLPPRNA